MPGVMWTAREDVNMVNVLLEGLPMHRHTGHGLSFRMWRPFANGSVITCKYDLLDRLTDMDIAPGPGVADASNGGPHKTDATGSVPVPYR